MLNFFNNIEKIRTLNLVNHTYDMFFIPFNSFALVVDFREEFFGTSSRSSPVVLNPTHIPRKWQSLELSSLPFSCSLIGLSCLRVVYPSIYIPKGMFLFLLFSTCFMLSVFLEDSKTRSFASLVMRSC